MTWCQHRARCEWCPKYIEAGQPLVTVFFWNKGTEGKRGFNVKQYYHPLCWVGQGLHYLERNPYVSVHKGARGLVLTPEQRMQRNRLLRRKGALEQRRRNLKTGLPDSLLMEARIDRQVAELMIEIAPIGGIPQKWLRI